MHLLTGNADALRSPKAWREWAGEFFWGISDEQRQRMLRDRVWRHERSAGESGRGDKERPLSRRRPPLRAARLSRSAGRRAATNCRACTPTRTFPRSSARPACMKSPATAATARLPSTSSKKCSPRATTPSATPASMSIGRRRRTTQRHAGLDQRRVLRGLQPDEASAPSSSAGPPMRAGWMPTSARSSTAGSGTQNAQGLKQYFFPLAAGYWRAYNSPEESFWCCTGTGARSSPSSPTRSFPSRRRPLREPIHRRRRSTGKKKASSSSRSRNSRASKARRSRSNPRAHARTIHVRIPGWTTEDAR